MKPKTTLIESLRFAKSFLTLVLDPERTDQIFRMAEIGIRGQDQRGAHAVARRALNDPGFALSLHDGYNPPTPDLERLARLPVGTLGHALAALMQGKGLDPEFYEPIEPTDEIRYLELRLRQTHDIWHVLTGFATDVKGELGLQAFMLAQTRSGISAAILAAGLLHFLLKDPARIPEVMDEMADGYRMGKEVACYWPGIRFEEMWERPLREVRRAAGLLDRCSRPSSHAVTAGA